MPDYFGEAFDAHGDGFFMPGPIDPGLAHEKNLTDSNYWVVLACALERAKKGNFDVFDALLKAMSMTRDGVYWLSCGPLLAYAAPYSALRKLRSVFTEEKLQHASVIALYCETLAHAMAPWAIDEMIELYRATEDENVRVWVAEYFSQMLEDEPGEIKKGPLWVARPMPPPPFEEYDLDYESHAAKVRRARDLLVKDPETPILAGKIYDAETLMLRLLKHAAAGEDSMRTGFERMLFEGSTGISCSDFFGPPPQLSFRPLTAAAIVEDFLKNPLRKPFAPGTRYFFKHAIPA